ncbi:hypothetical protein Cyrtocomes_00794 [Candidatus Cyrtobacter comes]|uniref:Uncharacterized protein n=1 Tax=Candidatus Cyrtobacter comes TaxID=675776 RepID=A0ABU5L9A8_9RICK|nr:hypothetical protein [Candidatus Cyrtobacter comes]MDZ5762414.1 hypothetical protein [Candidatus Cyrtobacter comes]
MKSSEYEGYDVECNKLEVALQNNQPGAMQEALSKINNKERICEVLNSKQFFASSY